MGSFSVWHLSITVIWLALLVAPMFPIAAILKKAGFSPWWALMYLVPVGNIVALFVFAYARWPSRA